MCTDDRCKVEVVSLEVSLPEELSGDERGHAALHGPRFGDGGEVARRHEHAAHQPAPLRAPRHAVRAALLRHGHHQLRERVAFAVYTINNMIILTS